MDTDVITFGFWASPFGITLLSLGSLIVLAVLSWAGSKMFSWFRSRIIVKQKPQVIVVLIRRKTGRDKPYPIIRIILKGINVFTRQTEGHYWLTAELYIDNQKCIRFKNEKAHYQPFMDLGDTVYFETELPDWSYWDNKGELLKEAKFTSRIFINDRSHYLTRCQKPLDIETWEQ